MNYELESRCSSLTDCIFCKIANKEMGQLIYEDESVVAFNDVNPKAPVHVLIIPKKHIERLSHVRDTEDACLAGHALEVAGKIAKELGVLDSGYRVVINEGEAAGQSVWHIHFHLLGGRELGWPPG
jgi:histidine triad (HIT) family protein